MKKYKSGNKLISRLLIGGSVIAVIFGAVLAFLLPDSEHNLTKMAGMVSGAGTGLLLCVVFFTLRDKFGNQQKREQREIDAEDERNKEISHRSWEVGAFASLAMFVIICFVFVGMGRLTEAVIAIGCLYIEIIIVGIASRIIDKKM